MPKVYTKGNYFFIEELDGTVNEDFKSNVRIGKQNVADTTYFITIRNNTKTYELADLTDVNGDAYTQETFETFYESNTGFSTGGSTATDLLKLNTADNRMVFRGISHGINTTTRNTYGGFAFSATATVTAQTLNPLVLKESYPRLLHTFVAPASASKLSSVRGQQQWAAIGKGFRAIISFSVADTTTGNNDQQMFMGLAGSTTALPYGGAGNINVTLVPNIIGIGYSSGDARLQLLSNDAVGGSLKVTLNDNWLRTDFNPIYTLELYNEYNTTAVNYRVTNQNTNEYVEGTITEQLPDTSVLLNIYASRTMDTLANVNTGAFNVYQMGIWTQY